MSYSSSPEMDLYSGSVNQTTSLSLHHIECMHHLCVGSHNEIHVHTAAADDDRTVQLEA